MLVNTLQLKCTINSSVPPWKQNDGNWAITLKEKANLLSRTFTEKCVLPAEELNDYSEILQNDAPSMSGFLPLRVRHTRSFLKQLQEDSATGLDLLPARILKECSAALALPITLLNRNILFHGIWPEGWRHHWLFALHKKHAKSNPRHYLGIHLTPQLSKNSERCIGNVFLPYLEKVGAYGPN